MRIGVLLKEVPDTYSDPEMSMETGLTDRTGDVVSDEVGERAVEAALRIAEGIDGAVVELLSVGPESAAASIRKGIAMGASEAYLISDDALIGADVTLTAEVLAAVVEKNDYDLVVTGAASSDGGGGVMASLIGELLNYPSLNNLTEVSVEGSTVTATQAGDGEIVRLEATLPAVVGVSDGFPDARFPNFKGLMAAKKHELKSYTLAELGVDPEDWDRARSIMVSIERRPARERGEIIDGDSTAAAALVDFLQDRDLLPRSRS
ncbi:electron transfer flavoprotein subunit beta/FixA family protein [Corynebacterium mayonis]|uniref:electron transfer flavoprotein subunit beta/FixA family protein n=1 Tax=Corynebacterium mayonis TaxID=3062461 RepID=UPI0031409CB1